MRLDEESSASSRLAAETTKRNGRGVTDGHQRTASKVCQRSTSVSDEGAGNSQDRGTFSPSCLGIEIKSVLRRNENEPVLPVKMLSDDLPDDMTAHIGQTEIPAGIAIGKRFVIEA